MSCFTDEIAGDILIDCDNLAIAGVEDDVVILPHDTVDKTVSTINATNRLLLDVLACTSGNTGFLLEGVKQAQGFLAEFVPSTDTFDKWRHTYDGVIGTPSAANRLQASKLSKGKPYMVVIRRRYKGAAKAEEFIVLGWDAGLYVTAMTENSRENDGMIKFTLASKDITLEYDMFRTLLDTDNGTTLTAFTNKFATA